MRGTKAFLRDLPDLEKRMLGGRMSYQKFRREASTTLLQIYQGFHDLDPSFNTNKYIDGDFFNKQFEKLVRCAYRVFCVERTDSCRMEMYQFNIRFNAHGLPMRADILLQSGWDETVFLAKWTVGLETILNEDPWLAPIKKRTGTRYKKIASSLPRSQAQVTIVEIDFLDR